MYHISFVDADLKHVSTHCHRSGERREYLLAEAYRDSTKRASKDGVVLSMDLKRLKMIEIHYEISKRAACGMIYLDM